MSADNSTNFTAEELASEEWRDVPGFPHYQASDLGRIRSTVRFHKTVESFLKDGSLDTHGYLQLSANGRLVLVHKLVLLAFHGPKPTPKHECLHRDDIKTNNRASNLRWGTHKENMADKIANGNQPQGEEMVTSKMSDADVVECRKLYATGKFNNRELAETYGVDDTTMQAAIIGRTYKHLPFSVPLPEGRKRRGNNGGDRNARAIITNEQAEKILVLHDQGKSQSEIGRLIGISRKVIGGVVRGQTFRHLPGSAERRASVRRFGNASLSEDDVRDIRRLYQEGMSYAAIGRKKGVSEISAANVIKGKTWKHVT